MGYVDKVRAGAYRLSTKGKEYANKLDTDANTMERQTKTAVLLFAVRGSDNDTEILIQQRLKNPFYGFWCRPSGKVRWGKTLVEAAKRELLEETGLVAEVVDIRGLYHKIDYRKEDNELLEDKIFYVAWCNGLTGELREDFEGGRNAWMRPSDIAKLQPRFEGIDKDHELYIDAPFRFDEKIHYYGAQEY